MGKVIGVGSDHAGFELKTKLLSYLRDQSLVVEDFGAHSHESVDYPDVAHQLALAIEDQRIERGVLVCGTGVGMSIAANRHAGVRAIVCSEPLSVRMSRQHNDANVVCLGARIIGEEMAQEIVDEFLRTEFDGGRHARRIAKLEL